MVITLAVIVAVLVRAVVVIGLPVLDRLCVAVAERKAAECLSVPFGHPAQVRVHGTPFVTQALRGCYRSIEVSGGGLRIGEMAGATLEASLHNGYLPLRELLGRRVRELLTLGRGNAVRLRSRGVTVARLSLPGLVLTNCCRA